MKPKVYPNSIEAERAVLGSIMLDNACYNKIQGFIFADDFYLGNHQIIFKAITDMIDLDKIIDLQTLAFYMQKEGTLEGIGGPPQLMDLLEATPTSTVIVHYSEILKEISNQRKVIKYCQDVFDKWEKINPGELLTSCEDLINNIQENKKEKEIFTANDLTQEIKEIHEKGGLLTGVNTPWSNLSKHCRIRKGLITIITGSPSSGKALALDTEVLTDNGWQTIGTIKVGDKVYDEEGRPCNVIAKTKDLKDRPCYEMEFSDKTKIKCDENHLWVTRDNIARQSEGNAKKNNRIKPRTLELRGNDQTHKRTFPSPKTTKEISKTLFVEKGTRRNHGIKKCKPITMEGNHELLELPPYVLGAWLADGTSRSGQITTGDHEIMEIVHSYGFTISKHKAKYHYGVNGLQVILRMEGVLNNKHIPNKYLLASVQNRINLLQGLMDSDGYVSKLGNCEYTTVRRNLADEFCQLVNSLGIIARVTEGVAKIDGRIIGPKYRIHFTPDFQVFRLPRKAKRLNTNPKRGKYRSIEGCSEVESVPVQCIQVDSPSGQFLITRSFIPTHNSTLLDNIILHLAEQERWRTVMYSPENYPLGFHVSSLIEKYSGYPMKTQHGEQVSPDAIKYAMDFIDDFIVFLQPTKAPTIETLFALTKSIMKKKKVDCLVIDPFNMMSRPRDSRISERESIETFLRKIRSFSRKYDIHIFVVAHPRKLEKQADGNYKPASAYDILGASDWYNAADYIYSVWRDLIKPENPTVVYVQKVKFKELGGPGYAKLTFNHVDGRYDDYIGVNEYPL